MRLQHGAHKKPAIMKVSNMRLSPLACLALLLASAPASAPARLHIGSSDGPGRACIKLRSIRDESAEDDQHLLLHVGGGRVYRNTLAKPCDDLRSINSIGKLRLQPKGDEELCAGDTVLVSGTGIFGAVGLGDSNDDTRSCKLGEFEATSEMSLTEELRR
jgi:hypothetical protein